ncbi:hypothetical protein KDA_02580 [Dictyobacter alpinus]|uniref:Bacterial transcriptional activator domain-containing protein n=1 Tax=Dictyobacter alpinus TaxID=2014873 RepID=A0A402B098_9CHLR|nr:tetratricopeptide repeat protein [Dictyobacter alpinus]GCE24774.1 hypothetical protein KDA_02580 [Dictyobacter alpinus]
MAQITLRNYLQETEDAISSKRVDEALASCQYVLAFFPESLEAQRLLGEVYLAQDKLEDAQQSFDWILTNDPENVIAYCSRALVSERMSDYDTALDCYQQAYELSRGNGQIRQAFNHLSEKVGQPGFMFSRAGLARLYMRGDLLAQASQEWDTVLAISPDRLDARTGLLEVYWRQGLYDRAAQIAEQILHDVPGCLKALLILAFVTAPQDMFRSKELIKRVEALDPDLVMAHDLFADHLTRSPNDPFLKLLRKSPATLGTAEQATKVASSQNSGVLNQLNAAGAPISADALSSWGSNAGWNNDETLLKSRSNEPAAKDSKPSWMSEGLTPGDAGMVSSTDARSSSWSSDSWRAAESGLNEPAQGVSNGTSNQSEPWQLLQNALNSISPDVVRQASDPGLANANPTSWSGTDNFVLPSHEPENSVQSPSGAGLASNDSSEQFNDQSWSFDIPEQTKDNSATPDWLSQLTNNEKQPLQDQSPVEQPATLPDPFTISPVSQAPVQQPISQVPIQPPVQQPTLPEPEKPEPEVMPDWARMMQSDGDGNSDDADEESFFGPDWLKSLGAASLDGTGEFFKLTEESEPLAQQKASGASWEQSQTTPEQPKTSSGTAWEQSAQPSGAQQKVDDVAWEQLQTTPEQPKASSGTSWSQPAEKSEQPKAQAFYDPSWLLEPAPQSAKNSVSAWEQPQAEENATNSPAWTQPGDQQPQQELTPSVTNQADQENDPWLAWQAAYAQPQQNVSPSWTDLPQQQQESQDYWSSSSQANANAGNSEQPSWMQQLSESSSTSSSNQEYDDWAASLATPSSQQSEPAWNDNASSVQEPEVLAQPEQPQFNQALPIDVPPTADDPWAKLNQQLQSQAIDYDWLAQLAGNNQSGTESVQNAPSTEAAMPQADNQQEKAEQNLLTTLEDLEQKLLSRGFTPLEPNSLADIAQAQEQSFVPEAETKQATESGVGPEPSLSSALAELGNFFPHPATPTGQAAEQPQSQATTSNAEEQPVAEPAWLAALSTVPAARATEEPQSRGVEASPEQQPVVEPSWLAALSPVPSVPATSDTGRQATESAMAEGPVEQPVAQVPIKGPEPENIPAELPAQVEPTFSASNKMAAVPPQVPAARANPLLDNELETTMRRPAVRLQPMQQRTTVARDPGVAAVNRSRNGERASQRQADTGSNVSQRERLLRGYQAQLIGDFDNAMQEYRIIIRNAPELLGEVVSNVRALLKLAPNYSAGYRVLGDAYMRQGEYLQAMEAYNKALTMAKKSKG